MAATSPETLSSKAPSSTVPPTSFVWRNTTVTVTDKATGQPKNILDDISGFVQPGEVLGILGPSGSGKTTLLHTLAGKPVSGATTHGDILLNGKAKDGSFRRLAAYVQQEPTLMGILTVRETMRFSARLAGARTRQEEDAQIDEILEELGMTSAADTRVGDLFYKGISGGQKKRLSLGVELLKRPSLLLLDEFTSGLDSAASVSIMSSVRSLARRGRTIVATVHQPSSAVLFQFDRLLILSKGKAVYLGPTKSMIDHLSSIGLSCPVRENPADFVLNAVNTDFPGHADVQDMVAQFDARLRPVIEDNIQLVLENKPVTDVQEAEEKMAEEETPKVDASDSAEDAADSTGETPEKTKEAVPADKATSANSPSAVVVVNVPTQSAGPNNANRKYAAGYWTQFSVLVARNWLNNLRNIGVFWIRIFMYSLLSLMIGTMYLGQDKTYASIPDRLGILFFISAFLVFMSIAALPFFIQQRAVFERERSNGHYAVAPYVIANFVAMLPGVGLITIISSVCIYFMADLNEGGFGVFVAALFLALVIAESFQLLMAAMVPHYIIGMAISSGVFGFFMLVEGFFKRVEDIPPYWVWGHYIGFHTYAYRIFAVNEFRDATFGPIDLPFSLSALGCPSSAQSSLPPTPGNTVLEGYGMEDADMDLDFGILILQAVLYQLLFFIVLQVRYTPRHGKSWWRVFF